MKRPLLVLSLLLFLAACATSSGGTRRSSRTITADEIAETSAISVHDAIRQLRPQWLTTRASPTMGSVGGEPPVVYVDGIREDDFRVMERLRANQVDEIRYMSPTDATNRYGTNHRGGAILITTKG